MTTTAAVTNTETSETSEKTEPTTVSTIPPTPGTLTPNPLGLLRNKEILLKRTFAGLLIFGDATKDTSPEFWSPYDATKHTDLPDTSSKVLDLFSLDAVGDTVIACWDTSCEKLFEGSWVPHSNTLQPRSRHTSAVHEGRILLVGGSSSPTSTEWVNMDGAAAEAGFPLQDPGGRQNHCSITLENSPAMILTGGGPDKVAGVLVTQYSLSNGDSLPMSDLTEPREYHACGVYQMSEGSQVEKFGFMFLHFRLKHPLYSQMLIVAGGAVPGVGTRLQSTEVLDLSQE